MSTIDPAICADTVSSRHTPQTGKPSRLAFYLLSIGVVWALVAFLSFCVMWVQWQMSAPGISPISGDFISFWTGGRMALAGHAAAAYDEIEHFFAELALHHDPDLGYVAFFYPPFFLLLCMGFALLPYFSALCLWLATTCALYAAALRALVPKSLRERERIWLLFLGYPAVMINAGFGQNGFLSTALFGGAAIFLDRQPALAGLCLGCLAYKPQLGVIVPLALAVAGRWRCFAAAAATVVTLAILSTLAFGIGIWPTFVAGTAEAQHNWLEAYNPLYLKFLISIFGAVRLHDGSLALAYTLQAAVSVAAVLALVFALRQRPAGVRSGRAEIAAIAACVPFCSPFLLEYDLIILAVPMVWLLSEGLRDGFGRGEGIALVAGYLAPALYKVGPFEYEAEPFVIVAAGLLFAVVLRRMMQAPALPRPTAGLEPAVPIGPLQQRFAT